MIENKLKHKEKMKQSYFIPKPQSMWFGEANANPEQLGLHQMQKNKQKRKKK